jgi:cell division protein ZapE
VAAVPFVRDPVPVAQPESLSGAVPLSVEAWIGELPHRPPGGELLERFVPPPRFRGCTFGSYRPDAEHPSQARASTRLRAAADAIEMEAGPLGRVRRLVRRGGAGRGLYLDGGFGVGKTHLLAALWNAVPAPKAFLSFDELVHTVGLLGVRDTRDAFRGYRLAAVDEWELDDPGNLKLALAWLRGALADGMLVAVTSNTIPDELGRGRFSQKSFTAELEELAAAFEVLTIQGEDYRHRVFRAEPGREYFRPTSELERFAAANRGEVLFASFTELVDSLGRVHPIQFGGLVERIELLLVTGLDPFTSLTDALRWVHFIDKLYDAAVPMVVSSESRLSDLFPSAFFEGGYAKKFGRCLSRMEELLGDSGAVS